MDDATLDRLLALSKAADPAPWQSWVEGRDGLGGDTFIMVGAGNDRREDLYLTRDSGPADAATYDLLAEARNALPALVAEIKRLRSVLSAD